MPQFVMTGVASIIFAIFDGTIPKNSAANPGNSTATPGELAVNVTALVREELVTPAAPNSYAIVFRYVPTSEMRGDGLFSIDVGSGVSPLRSRSV